MHKSVFESGIAAAKKTKFAIRPEAAMLDPAAQEIVLSGNPKARCSRGSRRTRTLIMLGEAARLGEGIGWPPPKKVCQEFRINQLVRIQAQNPISRGFLESRIL